MKIEREMVYQKLIDTNIYVKKLEEVLPENVDEFLDNLEIQLICQRIYEILTQTMLDICYHIVVKQELKIPGNYGDCIKALNQLEILSAKEVDKYRLIIGMRNIIVHQYGKIDLELLYHGLSAIIEDFNNFAIKIKDWIDREADKL